jgi:hypothetical protein
MAGHHGRPKQFDLLFLLLSLALSHSFISLLALAALTPSTSMTIPPLQWINLTGLLSGPSPPPLSGSSIGYDETTRSLLIFGGESAPSCMFRHLSWNLSHCVCPSTYSSYLHPQPRHSHLVSTSPVGITTTAQPSALSAFASTRRCRYCRQCAPVVRNVRWPGI